jgi:hypothetical protein
LVGLIDPIFFTWAIVGGAVTAITSLVITIRVANDNFTDDPGVTNFIVFIGRAVFYSVIYSLRHLFFTLVAILAISLVISVVSGLFG